MTDLEDANKNGVLVKNGVKYFFILMVIFLFCWFGPMLFVALFGHK